MIALITSADGEKALLGRKGNWPEGQYSTLAGFTEMGESLEVRYYTPWSSILEPKHWN
jgi:NADH pyrophosphatase NudC (nudix superfamily)